ncbi:Thr operon leader peptide [Samsonia erythrinae]|uniref:thr operon leader peptide n=1 Tax=Samsonia erythrinae TaxID=160434 RepID=A0A4R3VND9_9GAMM|nr:Thr operon leader peptide [Samsonia erythrinae]
MTFNETRFSMRTISLIATIIITITGTTSNGAG